MNSQLDKLMAQRESMNVSGQNAGVAHSTPKGQFLTKVSAAFIDATHTFDIQPDFLHASVNTMVRLCHGANAYAGWWGNAYQPDPRSNPLCFSNKLLLIHSEVSEAMEGDRTDAMDDKLPQYKMRDVELADAVIRIFDLAGAYNIPLAEILTAKMQYNLSRVDHTPEARAKAGGKKY